jgi:hypothetical protein
MHLLPHSLMFTNFLHFYKARKASDIILFIGVFSKYVLKQITDFHKTWHNIIHLRPLRFVPFYIPHQ